jgi:predicted Zn-dependent protease
LIFHEVLESFRRLAPAERNVIRDSRLRVRKARPGETPTAIAKRWGASWTGPQVGVANAVADGGRFESGHLVKLALPERYTPGGR